jgi:hypothetical protein
MSRHSAIVGGSTAGRMLNCPASLARIRALPPTADQPSEYAQEGTFAHEVMAALMDGRRRGVLLGDDASVEVAAHVGIQFHDRQLTHDHLDSMIYPALEHLDTLEQEFDTGGAFEVVGVEQRVTFPGVPGAFGTVDLILQNPRFTILADWKFGQGVGVKCVYSDGEGAIVNPQLLYYAAAALKTKPGLFARRRIVVAIVQPRGLEPLTFTEVSRRELKMFVEDMHGAVLAAVDRDPPMRRGEHCRWAPCKIACPLWTGPLLDLSALQDGAKPARELNTDPRRVSSYGAYLARAKALLDSAVQFKAEIDAQMHAYLENGGSIPGWRLKAKATRRQWVDNFTVAATLFDLGFSEDDIWRRELVTFKEAEATAKRLGVAIPDELRVAPPPSGTTLATVDDPAPAVEPQSTLMEKFAASLRLLQQGQE